MDPADPARPSIVSALQSFGDSVIATIQQRAELVSIELQEEKYRLIQIVLWVGAAAFAAVMATTFVSITLVYVFWETARLPVLIGLTVFYVAALVYIIVAFRRYLARQPKALRGHFAGIQEGSRPCIQRMN